MDVNNLSPLNVLIVYSIVEILKWLGNKIVSEKEQFKILANISRSQEAVAESFNHVALILEKILDKMGVSNVKKD